MVNRYQIIKRASWLVPAICLALFFQLFFWGGTSSAVAGEKNYREMIGKARFGSQDLQEKLELAEFNQAFLKRVEEEFTQLRQDEVFLQKIREIPAGLKMQAYRDAFKQAELQGFKLADHFRDLTEQRKTLLKGAQVGSISGTVTIEGSTPGNLGTSVGIEVYDSFGFFVTFASVNTSGSYTVPDLEAGDYFVVTSSDFVDEFFNDIPLNFFESWRDAQLVTVVDGQTNSGIDFDLARGATVSGTITEADGTTPIANSPVNFEITAATNPEVLFDVTDNTNGSGEYEIVIPATGSFKISASVSGFVSEYYNNKASFASADPILIESLDETKSGIDFSLERIEEPSGGTIIGNVLADTAPPTPLPFSFVFAFNVADTSISGFAVTGFPLGDYELSAVEPGEHVLFANNYLTPIFPLIPQVPFALPVVRGQYYQEAETSADAMPLTIATDEDTLTDINFNLTSGGTISGTITDANDAPLDTVIVAALKWFDPDNVSKFFFDDIDIGVGFSVNDGSYSIGGLSTGDYIVRTFSLLDVNVIDGHSGVVLDEYYEDVQSLFEIKQASAVSVTSGESTTGIDFSLDLAGAISGHFFEADGSTPIMGEGTGATVLAFDAETGNPELAFSTFNSTDGSYELRPMRSGNFFLLGFADSGNDVTYLPQFFDGAASLETATSVAVTAPNVTTDINFDMIRAGSMEGLVNLSPDFPVGADSLEATLVVAFEANSGELAAVGETTFAGGYRFPTLAPGQYKVAASALADGYAGTYHGGANSFDAVNAEDIIEVSSDVTTRADIDLTMGEGTISGTVTDPNGEPLNGVLVLAYDQTGHVVSAGLSGFDIVSGLPLSPGQYQIEGLVAGSYFVRTFSLFQILNLVEEITDDLGDDPLGGLLGLLSGDFIAGLDIELFADAWYENEPVEAEVDTFSLVFSLLAGGGGDIPLIIPFFDTVPSGAQAVSVDSPGETTGIDFMLEFLGVTDVAEAPDLESIPSDFHLFQNYPNPFNPSTVINYSVPQTAEVKLRIYNLLGQRIRTLFDGLKQAGVHTTQWDGRDDRGQQVAAGLYFLRLETENQALSRKMLLVR